MKAYGVSEAIMFLQERYGRDNMPTSEETLRRAIRTGELKVQEQGDPGRKGYTILETNLVEFAERRMSRIRARRSSGHSERGAYTDRTLSAAPVASSNAILEQWKKKRDQALRNLSELNKAKDMLDQEIELYNKMLEEWGQK